MGSNINFEEFFTFLENAPEFYQKERKGNNIIYTFYTQDDPYKSLGVIKIPYNTNKNDINWNFISISEENPKPELQISNSHYYHAPVWFKNLLNEVTNIYKRIVNMFSFFGTRETGYKTIENN